MARSVPPISCPARSTCSSCASPPRGVTATHPAGSSCCRRTLQVGIARSTLPAAPLLNCYPTPMGPSENNRRARYYALTKSVRKHIASSGPVRRARGVPPPGLEPADCGACLRLRARIRYGTCRRCLVATGRPSAWPRTPGSPAGRPRRRPPRSRATDGPRHARPKDAPASGSPWCDSVCRTHATSQSPPPQPRVHAEALVTPSSHRRQATLSRVDALLCQPCLHPIRVAVSATTAWAPPGRRVRAELRSSRAGRVVEMAGTRRVAATFTRRRPSSLTGVSSRATTSRSRLAVASGAASAGLRPARNRPVACWSTTWDSVLCRGAASSARPSRSVLAPSVVGRVWPRHRESPLRGCCAGSACRDVRALSGEPSREFSRTPPLLRSICSAARQFQPCPARPSSDARVADSCRRNRQPGQRSRHETAYEPEAASAAGVSACCPPRRCWCCCACATRQPATRAGRRPTPESPSGSPRGARRRVVRNADEGWLLSAAAASLILVASSLGRAAHCPSRRRWHAPRLLHRCRASSGPRS